MSARHRCLVLAAGLGLAFCVTLPASAQSPDYGVFHYIEDTDDFTDEDRSFIMTMDEDEDGGLGWKCMGDGLNVILSLDGYMGGNSDDKILVRYRFDKKEPSSRHYWGLFQDHKQGYLPMGRVSAFTASARSSAAVVMEATDPLDGETRRYHFQLNGFRQAISKLPCAK